MKTTREDVVAQLLSEAGLKPSRREIKELALFLDLYQDRLEQLRAINVGHEEVAGVFSPHWNPGT